MRGQLRWLRAQGWECLLATSPGARAVAAAEAEGAELYPLPMSRSVMPLADLVGLARWIRLIWKTKPHAVNVSTPKAALLGSVSAFVLGVPKRIYVMRGLRLEGARGVAALLLWAAERLTIACSTDVIFVSHSLAEAASGRGLGAKGKGVVIAEGSSNGVDVERVLTQAVAGAASIDRESIGLLQTDAVVGFVGRIAADKGLDTLIRVFQNAAIPSRLRLLVVGGEEDAELTSSMLSLGEKVRWVGEVDNVPAYMRLMDMLCLPTRREGFPNVVLEAGAMQLPVVTTKATGSIDSVVDNETGLLVDIDDDQGLLRALRTLADHPEVARMMGMEGYERAVRDFNPTRIWSGVLAILNSDYEATDLHPVSEVCSKNNQKEL